MASERDARRWAYLDKAAAEIDALAARGALMGGNAFSSVLLVKGELTDAEKGGEAPFSGADGTALRASLDRLGYPPEDWAWLLTVDEAGEPLDAVLLREAVCALDPATLVCCDEAAAALLREAYADDLAALESLDEALLAPGAVARVLGVRFLNLGGFAAALASGDAHEKQVMWARLKKVPPLGEPF
ncbi:hypothetical protein [Olsenella sp. An293]|uniref:hypothetical protein n=1 Tax=Olsenella sp. An293 TaxID=1965626 RepID=UPI000B39C3F0|nr:hypothetical protein [Olsenella sp. An293]OUO33625.1 hypothetical protein B5F85_01885 [Olsenella sp. An293]